MNEDTSKMLRDLRRVRSSAQISTPTRQSSPQGPTARYDFADHPAYGEVRVAKAASEVMSVASPFFRQAEAVDGTRLKLSGRWVENFGSYDYLGLNADPDLRDKARAAITEWGVSATASRLVGGERQLHAQLETTLAAYTGREAALAFVSGHATNMSIIRTLMGPDDLVLVDALAHNSIYEGIKASGARHLTFAHNDAEAMETHLEDVRAQYRNVLVVIEGLYSMDGDCPDLPRFVSAKARHGAWLMVDEAHSFGVVGATGRGICEMTGVDPNQVDITMGTLSKTFASCGGFVAGSEPLIDLLRYKAPGFVYSVGLSAPNTAAAEAAVTMAGRAQDRVSELAAVSAFAKDKAEALGLNCGLGQGHAVLPIMIGDSVRATQVSNQLLDRGFNVLPVIAPAVANKSARLRFFLNYGHTRDVVDAVLTETADVLSR